MKFYPKNKYLSVVPVEDAKPEGQTSGFILPEDYKDEKLQSHTVVRLLGFSLDSAMFTYELHRNGNQLLLVNTSMLEKIKIGSETIWLVPESAVCGLLDGMV